MRAFLYAERAYEASQRYKVGCFILVRALVLDISLLSAGAYACASYCILQEKTQVQPEFTGDGDW